MHTDQVGNSRSLLKSHPTQATASVIATITKLVQDYTGSMIDATDSIYFEMTDMFFRSFGHIGIDEIREAFRLGVTGKISGIVPDSFKSWHGCFSVASFGLVMSAYDQYRSDLVRKVEDAKNFVQTAAYEYEKQNYWTSEEGITKLAEMRAERIAELKSMQNATFHSVTLNDYNVLTALGLINLQNCTVDRRWQLMADAQSVAKAQLAQTAFKSRVEGERLDAAQLLNAINAGFTSETFESSARVIAQRMAVVDWILQQQFESVEQ